MPSISIRASITRRSDALAAEAVRERVEQERERAEKDAARAEVARLKALLKDAPPR